MGRASGKISRTCLFWSLPGCMDHERRAARLTCLFRRRDVAYQSVLTRGLSRGRASGVGANARGEGSVCRESVGLQVSRAFYM